MKENLLFEINILDNESCNNKNIFTAPDLNIVELYVIKNYYYCSSLPRINMLKIIFHLLFYYIFKNEIPITKIWINKIIYFFHYIYIIFFFIKFR